MSKEEKYSIPGPGIKYRQHKDKTLKKMTSQPLNCLEDLKNTINQRGMSL